MYDGWARAGNTGWSYEDVLPFFKMSEDNKNHNNKPALRMHGFSGPIPVQRPAELLPMSKALIEAGRELGYASIDMSDPELVGFSTAQLMMDDRRQRVTTAAAYLRPHLAARSRNLHVLINSHVTRLLVDARAKTVRGVEYVDALNRTRRLRARKEVVLSAGVIGSPHALMLSGVGPAEDLEPLGVPVVQNLRVGHNLQHHVATAVTLHLTNITHDRQLTYDSVTQYLRHRMGPLSVTGCLQTSAFLRSDAAGSSGPADVQLFFDGFSANCESSHIEYGCAKRAETTRVTVRPVNLRPRSRGTMRLVSADPFVRLAIDPGYLTVAEDVEPLLWALRLIGRLTDTAALRRLGARVDTTPAELCEGHKFGTDSYWRCVIRYYTRGENHHAGTCKMGPATDPTAVVGPDLRVHGLRGIRVADASVLPEQPNCNPIAPIVMVAEKAAWFIKDTWA